MVWAGSQALHDLSAARPGARERLRRRLERSGRFGDGRLDLGIEAEGRLVGTVDARQPEHALPPGVFELGIGLFAEAERGRGYGSEAVALLTEHLFAARGAGTATWNAPMRRVLAKLGFVEEGVLRGFLPAPGGRDDTALYGVTKTEWRGRKP